MANLQAVLGKVQLLKQEWSKPSCNLQKCGELLAQLKVSFVIFFFSLFLKPKKSVETIIITLLFFCQKIVLSSFFIHKESLKTNLLNCKMFIKNCFIFVLQYLIINKCYRLLLHL